MITDKSNQVQMFSLETIESCANTPLLRFARGGLVSVSSPYPQDIGKVEQTTCDKELPENPGAQN